MNITCTGCGNNLRKFDVRFHEDDSIQFVQAGHLKSRAHDSNWMLMYAYNANDIECAAEGLCVNSCDVFEELQDGTLQLVSPGHAALDIRGPLLVEAQAA